MWFLAENVGGLRNANSGTAFIKILQDMNEAGYILTPHLYKFEQYGVPQARHRIDVYKRQASGFPKNTAPPAPPDMYRA